MTPTWGSLWWRVRLLARIWWAERWRWVVVRYRARKLGRAIRQATANRAYISDGDLRRILKDVYLWSG